MSTDAPAKVRLRLLLAYEGSRFRGWQSQATGDAVQDYVEKALSEIAGTAVSVQGAGRTDAGVHALGQVAHADVPAGRLPMERWLRAVNAHLPVEIRVLRVTSARTKFHARFDAKGKIYTYRIWHGEYLHPLEIGRAWHVAGELDVRAIRAGAAVLQGTHDFASFAANRGKEELSTTRTISRIAINQRGPLITLRYEGTGFLYKMVRLLTGSLVRCGQRKAEVDWLQGLLDQPGRVKTQFAAPAEGLYLTRVRY